MNIGNQIKKYREQLKISQEELADKIFVTRQTISNWENNKNYPDIKSLSLLSYNLNVSLDDLIKGDVEKMKEIIDEKEIKKLNFYSKILTICFAVLILFFGYCLKILLLYQLLFQQTILSWQLPPYIFPYFTIYRTLPILYNI